MSLNMDKTRTTVKREKVIGSLPDTPALIIICIQDMKNSYEKTEPWQRHTWNKETSLSSHHARISGFSLWPYTKYVYTNIKGFLT